MSPRNLAWLLVVPALVLLGGVMTATAPPPEKDYKLVRTLVDVLAEVDRNYYRELSDDDKRRFVEDMINGGLSRLDPHSQYFNEDDLKQFTTQTEGQFGGIGAFLMVDPRTQVLMIESPMIGTPAYDAGLQPGDLILKVNDTSTENLKIDEARALIKGPPGTQVKLNVLRGTGKQPEDVVLTRAIIELHPVQGFARRAEDPTKWNFMADDQAKIALIRLTAFNEKTTKEVADAIRESERDGAKAIILDMRDNPGGLLSEAIGVSNLFLTEGTIVSTKDRSKFTDKSTAKSDKAIYGPADKKPVAVLVNANTASASEIVAAALQDNNRAVVIGERSYGKGSVQQIHKLGDGSSALKLTGKVWLTPSGKNIHRWPDSKENDEWGVMPNAGFEVKLTPEDRLQYALHLRQLNLAKSKGHTPKIEKPNEPKLDPNYQDKVLQKAIEYLRQKLAEVGAALPERKPS
jgi:carboxyl-terminal processing protease